MENTVLQAGKQDKKMKKIAIFNLTPLVSALTLFTCLSMHLSLAMAGEWLVEKATKDVELRGYTRSIKTVVISSEVTGRILKLNYEVGDTIGKKKFAEIDSTFVDFDIQSTRVAVSKLKTRVKKMDSRIAYLKKEFQRKEQLFTKGRITEVIRDAASQDLDQALLDREALIIEQRSLNVTLKQLLEKKARHTITGFSQWMVTDRKVEAGEVIQAGMPLAVIQDFRQMLVPLAVSNDELEGIHEKIETDREESLGAKVNGQPVKVSIYYINPDFDEQSRKTNIKLLIHGYPNKQRGGLGFVLPLSVRSRGLKVPAKAVLNRYQNPKVFVQGRIEPVMVTILDAFNSSLIIADHPELSPGSLLSDPRNMTD